MTTKDLKLSIWYVEDNQWSKLWFIGVRENKWFIYDPDLSGALSVTDYIEDSDNIEIAKNQSKMSREIIRNIFDDTIDLMV